MAKSRRYNIQPASGQALLSFEGRRHPDAVMEVFETTLVEEARFSDSGEQKLLHDEKSANGDFRNLLLQGDCLSACAYLKEQNIKIDLVYIDPPFASGANYAKKIYLRNGGKTALKHDSNSIGEEVMYGDIWRKEDYLNWIYERLLAIREVMSETASIYVHLDWHIGHYVKVMMDEVFGEDNFVNEIIWHYGTGGASKDNSLSRKHDAIFFYAKNSNEFKINTMKERNYMEKSFMDSKQDESGQYYTDVILKDAIGGVIKIVSNDGSIIEYNTRPVLNLSSERLDYNTQKPEGLIRLLSDIAKSENMIFADFFCGSGTVAKVAHDLGHPFIVCDIGINSIQTTRDRLRATQADFDIYKIHDGLRLIRNPHQTEAIVRQIFGLIKGFASREQLSLDQFWDGGVAQSDGNFTPIKFTGINEKLTEEIFDDYLEQIYKLQDTTAEASGVMIVYAYKDDAIDEQYLKGANTQLPIRLKSLGDPARRK